MIHRSQQCNAQLKKPTVNGHFDKADTAVTQGRPTADRQQTDQNFSNVAMSAGSDTRPELTWYAASPIASFQLFFVQ